MVNQKDNDFFEILRKIYQTFGQFQSFRKKALFFIIIL